MNGIGTRQTAPVVGKPTGRCERKQHTERSPGHADQQALRHLFADEHKPAAAQGSAHGKLFAPGRAACHQQVGNVKAGDQQHTSHSTQEYDQRCLHILRHILRGWAQASLLRDRCRSMRKVDLILQCAHFIHCGCSAYPWLEPRHHMALMHVVPGKPLRVKSRCIGNP